MAADEVFRARVEAEVDGLDDVEKLARSLDELDGEKVEIPVEVDDQAGRDIDDLLEKVDRLHVEPAQLLLATNAAQITTDIADLLLDIDKLDSTDPTVDVKIERVNQLMGDLDQIQAKAREISDTPIRLDTTGATKGINDIGRSANSSKSVLANMVGNATQDLGALGGIAGSAGVAIGQMGEYMVDAAADGDKLGDLLRNFGKVAGPIALISIAMAAVSSVLGDQRKAAEEAAQRTEEFGNAMRDAAIDSTGLADVLRGNETAMRDFAASSNDALGDFGIAVDRLGEKLPLIGGFFDRTSTDIVQAMDDAGVSFYEFTRAVESAGLQGVSDFNAKLQESLDTGRISEEQFNALSEAVREYGASADDARQSQALLNVDQAEANALLAELVKKQAPLEQFTDQWKTLFDDMSDGTIDTKAAADAINFLADALGLTQEKVIELAKAKLDEDLKDQAKAADDAADATKRLAEAQDQANAKVEVANALFDRQAEESRRARDAIDEYHRVLQSNDWGQASLDGAVSALDDYVNSLFPLQNMHGAIVTGLEGVNEALDENGRTLDAATEAGRENIAAIEELAGAVSIQLADAYARSGGDSEKFAANMENVANQIRWQAAEAGLSKKQIDFLLDSMNLLPADVQTQFKLLGDADAQTRLGLLQGAIDNLKPKVQSRVEMLISKGEFDAALRVVQANLKATQDEKREAKIDVNDDGTIDTLERAMADLTDAKYEASFNVNDHGQIDSVARRADAAAVDRYLDYYVRVHGTLPSGGGGGGGGPGGPSGDLSSFPGGGPTTTSITVNAGVIGNRFDVARTVRQAMKESDRLNGSRRIS